VSLGCSASGTGGRITRWEKRNGGLVEAQLGAPPEQWAPALCRFVAGHHGRGTSPSGPADVDDSLDLLALCRARRE
jgi:hypothetical protein